MKFGKDFFVSNPKKLLKINDLITDYIQQTKKTFRGWAAKVLSLAISGGLVTASHSLALSHYWPTQGLLAAEFPPWPITPRLSQPDPPWLPKEVHIDADLSADAGSTWTDSNQGSHLQAIQQNLPPSSWITRACQSSRPYYWGKNVKQTQTVHSDWLLNTRKALSMSTTISSWKHQFSLDQCTWAALSCVSTCVGDPLGIHNAVDVFWSQ